MIFNSKKNILALIFIATGIVNSAAYAAEEAVTTADENGTTEHNIRVIREELVATLNQACDDHQATCTICQTAANDETEDTPEETTKQLQKETSPGLTKSRKAAIAKLILNEARKKRAAVNAFRINAEREAERAFNHACRKALTESNNDNHSSDDKTEVKDTESFLQKAKARLLATKQAASRKVGAWHNSACNLANDATVAIHGRSAAVATSLAGVAVAGKNKVCCVADATGRGITAVASSTRKALTSKPAKFVYGITATALVAYVAHVMYTVGNLETSNSCVINQSDDSCVDESYWQKVYAAIAANSSTVAEYFQALPSTIQKNIFVFCFGVNDDTQADLNSSTNNSLTLTERKNILQSCINAAKSNSEALTECVKTYNNTRKIGKGLTDTQIKDFVNCLQKPLQTIDACSIAILQ